jgi:hypothetical protein
LGKQATYKGNNIKGKSVSNNMRLGWLLYKKLHIKKSKKYKMKSRPVLFSYSFLKFNFRKEKRAAKINATLKLGIGQKYDVKNK